METLRNARACGRMSHAYLVCTSNPEWRLKFPLLIFALMSCESPNEDFSPCGDCPSCRRILDGTFPDMFSLAPISKARKIQIGEDENDPDTMRWFEGLFHLSSMTECGWKFGKWYDMVWMEKMLGEHGTEVRPVKRFDEVKEALGI